MNYVNENSHIDISIVIPIFNEEKAIQILYDKIKNMLKVSGKESEIIFVDDGSRDGSYEILKQLADIDKSVRVFRFDSNKGKCKGLEKGFHEARAEVIVTMDGDLQNDPDDIPKLISKLNEGSDVVCGWRWSRKDPWHKVLKSKIGNYVQRKITKIKLHDISCPMQAYKRGIVKDIIFQNRYDDFFLPFILSKYTNRITEVKIRHYQRPFGKSKYSFLTTSLEVVRNYIKLIND
jgi:glycosyltransferase involved in cell wall biosynthesis